MIVQDYIEEMAVSSSGGSRPQSRAVESRGSVMGDDDYGNGNGNGNGNGELSSREIAMVKGIQQLQEKLALLTAQYQALQGQMQQQWQRLHR